MGRKPSRRLAVARRLRIMLLATALAAAWSATSPAMAQSGDMNCNGAVDANDIAPFVLALLDPAGYAAAYPSCNINRADMNADGLVNGGDTQLFVAAMLAGPCGGCPPGTDCNFDPLNCGACGHACNATDYCSWGECYGTCIGCEQ